ncbi:MAG: glutathione S-transferase family protein [Deltaproteobacteria bacterium]|nr:glutathione S-transferase family protein [Deltaproteobacteria bacterium]
MNRLITIPFSHFCEKARWALERAGVPFREDGYLPMLQTVAAWRAGGKRTVPVLVTDGGAVDDSTDILRWCDEHGNAPPLFPGGALGREVAELEEGFDKSLGPATRRVAYHLLLPMPGAAKLLAEKAPARWQGRLMRAAYPLARAAMTRGLRLDDASAERSLRRVDEIFADVGALLADGRRYLAGDRFTAADLTFAALAAPLIIPPQYAAYLPPLDRMPQALLGIIDRLRATPAGAHALAMYTQHR